MEKIKVIEKNLPDEYRVINIEKVGDWILVETSVKSFLINKEGLVYDVGKYSHAENIYNMGDDIFAVLDENYNQDLVNIKTKEVYISQRSNWSGIKKLNDDFVYTFGSNYGKSVFNIRTKKFIKPEVDIEVKFSRMLGSNLFVYENNDYKKQIFQNFIVDQDGKLIYKCGEYFPYYTDGDLKDNEIVIVRNLYSGTNTIEIIKQNEMIDSNPLIHVNEKSEADAICFIQGKNFIITDLKMNVLKDYPLDIDYDKVKIQLWGDMAVIIVEKDNESYCIGLNIRTGMQVKHYGIWILPLDVKGPVVIRGCDSLGDGDYMFTLYNDNGEEYTHHCAKDCFNIHNKRMNLYKYTCVDGTDQNLVYNIDTRKEKLIPWYDVIFQTDSEFKYMPFGVGLRYGETWNDIIIDIVDEELNVVYEGIASKDYKIRGEDFHYELKNNLLLLIIPMSNGPRTYFRKVVINKEGNKLYDSFAGDLSFIGNYLQVIDNDKTYYIDSRTGAVLDEMFIEMNDISLPEVINVDGKEIKLLINKKANISSE